MQLGSGTYNVKLGKTFLQPPSSASKSSFMTMRCDFMPASVDRSQPGSINVADGSNEVVVQLPNHDASVGGPSSTVFRGSARPIHKECVLVYNKRTKELVLERIAHAVQLKKSRESGQAASAAAASTTPLQPSSQSTSPSGTNKKPSSCQQQQQSRPRTLSASSDDDSSVSSVSSDSSSSSSSSSTEQEQRPVASTHPSQGDQQKKKRLHPLENLDDSLSSLSSLSDSDNVVSTHQQRKSSSITKPSSGKKRQQSVLNANVATNSAHNRKLLIEHDLKLTDSDTD